jgi:hypothetical protein
MAYHELVPQPAERSAKDLCPIIRRHFVDPALLLRRRHAFDPGASPTHALATADVDGVSIRHCYVDRLPNLHTVANPHLHTSTRCERNVHLHTHRHTHTDRHINHDSLTHSHGDAHANLDEYRDHHKYTHQHTYLHGHPDSYSNQHCDFYPHINRYADRHADAHLDA